jgi:prepilin-type N-terminal cleavage/methylation domain-containing protein
MLQPTNRTEAAIEILRVSAPGPGARGRRGFTLIELLAVMAIIAILAAALVPQIPKWIDRANVTACSANMLELHKNFVDYQRRMGDWPDDGGIRFFLRLWKADPDSHDDTFAKRFTCPAVKPRLLPGINGRPPREWFDDWANLDSTYTAYAGRDIDRFPNLESNPGNQAIVCDDNELADTDDHPQPNHQYATVVLFANGAVRELDLVKFRDEGTVAHDKYIIPGPDCPVEELRTVRRDAPEPKKRGGGAAGAPKTGGSKAGMQPKVNPTANAKPGPK